MDNSVWDPPARIQLSCRECREVIDLGICDQRHVLNALVLHYWDAHRRLILNARRCREEPHGVH